MTSILILNAFEKYLRPLVENAGGVLDVCGSPEDTLAKLSLGPQKWRVILQWQSEKRVGKTKALTGTFLAIVQQSPGLPIARGSDIHSDRAGDPALLARMHLVNQWIMAARPEHSSIDCHSWDFPEDVAFLSDPEGKLPARQMMTTFSATYGLPVMAKTTLAM
jgi:hypothetical protein